MGVSGLDLRRGLADSAVVAPYATALATTVGPGAAASSFAALAALGGLGRYGVQAAPGFTPARARRAVVAGAVRRGRPRAGSAAMDAVASRLIGPEPGLALLFAPPFDRTTRDPGRIQGYPPGLSENGGQCAHAAMWSVTALAKLGLGDRGAGLFALPNPMNHALTPADAARYRVEPCVVAADVHAVAPHGRRGGAGGPLHPRCVAGVLGSPDAGGDAVGDRRREPLGRQPRRRPF